METAVEDTHLLGHNLPAMQRVSFLEETRKL